MGRKVFISVLGTNNYFEGVYAYAPSKYVSKPMRFIQEATLELLDAKDWSANDRGYVLVTSGAHDANWVDNGHVDRVTKEQIMCEGLASRIEVMDLPFSVEAVPICEGKNEEEIWSIFSEIYSKLREGDELYFDITHGFRYLPMLVLVLANYSKFLKSISLRMISYGNYEGRDKETNISPIVDLLSLSLLQDWSAAASVFVMNGSVAALSNLAADTVKPILRETKGQDKVAKGVNAFAKVLPEIVADIQTCRGMDIVSGKKVADATRYIADLKDTSIEPFNPIFEKIKSKLDQFGNQDDVRNGFVAAKWCIDNGMAQQATTILFEATVSFCCVRCLLDWRNEADRNFISSLLRISFDNTNRQDWFESVMAREKEADLILDDDVIKALAEPFSRLRELRNDINHCGIRKNPLPAFKYERKILEIFTLINDIVVC